MSENLLNLLKKITKAGNFKLLIALSEGSKRWSQLEKLIDKKTLSNSVKELFRLGLIEATIIHDTETGSKAYQLSPLGEKVVILLKEIEKEFEKYHAQALPEKPEEFIGEVLKDE